ncbi:MAG: ABC transporter ATP-binding protein [Flexistipes sinusarabici]|uniref:ABC transporter ATP-binding protein n=1 Tax=Flexistipes sinusarabici TaxID=2352 RepID=A0A5D0MKG1_FLESI|nr:ABC transporter ATP-binding protein [Flexistipes sinusarabici]TYB33476.1 MAG: ABC transporter ATP-binding protein [Flexistipes sinusarabici]
MAIIEIDGVSFAYEREPVLENVSLKVSKGDFLAVLGPNGGGKTTLLKLILGLIKPDKGSIKVFGEKPGKQSKKIGYVPQYSYINKNFPLSVIESVLMGLTKKKLLNFKYTETDKRRALETLDKVDMSDYSDKQIHDLSGGQRQRVLLARALLSDPDLIILDEPTSNIDPYGKFCFFTFLEELSRKKTIILVSHNINVIATKINRVACVNRFLYYNSEPVLTKEMVEILYGTHDEHACSFGKYFSDDFTHMEKRGGGD